MSYFNIKAKIKNALGRAGTIETAHGIIETPAFIPVATKATIKSLSPEQMRDYVGAGALLSNTYHLYLQPGQEVLEKAGGLSKFMNWSGPTFTDSGGFQAFSLGAAWGKGVSKLAKHSDSDFDSDEIPDTHVFSKKNDKPFATVDDDGVTFRSIIDGSTHRFTPEVSMNIQKSIGADIIFAFDECASPSADQEYQKIAMNRTHDWAKRCIIQHNTNHRSEKNKSNLEKSENNYKQALFGIVQGGRYEDLRKQSAKIIGGMDFDGFGIGGSFDKGDVATAVGWVNSELPENKPRHLLGIGEPLDLILGIENGVDTFDCVAPTRMARNGSLYVPSGRINILNSQFISDMRPIHDKCKCYTCRNYTRAYLSHLFRAKEMFAASLASIHNLYYVVNLVKEARVAILEDRFGEFKDGFMRENIRNQ